MSDFYAFLFSELKIRSVLKYLVCPRVRIAKGRLKHYSFSDGLLPWFTAFCNFDTSSGACFISISNEGLLFGNGWYETGPFAPGHFYLAKNPLFQCVEKIKNQIIGRLKTISTVCDIRQR